MVSEGFSIDYAWLYSILWLILDNMMSEINIFSCSEWKVATITSQFREQRKCKQFFISFISTHRLVICLPRTYHLCLVDKTYNDFSRAWFFPGHFIGWYSSFRERTTFVGQNFRTSVSVSYQFVKYFLSNPFSWLQKKAHPCLPYLMLTGWSIWLMNWLLRS